MEKQTTKEQILRWALLIVGLFFAGVGVALTKHGDIGTSPLSSIPNVLSIHWTFFTIGNWVTCWNLLMITGQVLLLRRRFQLIQLLQLPFSFLLGWFTDLGVMMSRWIPVESYPMKLVTLGIGILVLGFGLALTVIADKVLNSSEAFIKVLAEKRGAEFGNMKIIFDVTCVALALVLSLILSSGRVDGVREGTVIAAFCTGMVVKFCIKKLRAPLERALRR